MAYMPLNTENGIEIKSVGDFLKTISEIKSKSENQYSTFFFRGQEADFWKVVPSVFRDNMLSVEHNLLSEPRRRAPNEFSGMLDEFEIMEKYQHYGMCTRLLDITTNPLVALYFACLPHGEEEYMILNEDNSSGEELEKIKQEPYGVVYFREELSPIPSDDIKIKIIISLAKMDLDEKNIESVLESLFLKQIIFEDQKKKWQSEDGFKEFVKIVQSTYTVMPILSNQRLLRQSGAFLLPGKFNFTVEKGHIKEGKINKSECNMRNEFEKNFFYIAGENKERILWELDDCNINQPYLFPELEYQLRYIKENNMAKTHLISYFEEFTEYIDCKSTGKEIKDGFKKEELENIILSVTGETNSLEEIVNVIDEIRKQTDWYKKESIISRMKVKITKILLKSVRKEVALKMATDIVKSVLQ
jgi:hypothetical protein